MTLSKTRDAALLGTLMLAGCAAPMNSSSQTENSTLSIHEVLEQVDRNDLRLTSYRMNSIEKFRSLKRMKIRRLKSVWNLTRKIYT